MESFVAVAGTLFGALIGVSGSYLIQRNSYRSASGERLADLRRQTCLEFLASAHEMFVQIDEIHRLLRRRMLTEDVAKDQLVKVDAGSTQTALEALRLVASDGVAESAAELWIQLRRRDEPRGRLMDRRHYDDWRDSYWLARRRIIDSARRDIGFEPLDWASAGVTRH
ncbi:hypothetical protein FXB39_16850 [Nocardioides sp. BGMRC 2183]|nr:hypothetical protein FXB39_16850 [Nocardioides sp. BGMRC 2183]